MPFSRFFRPLLGDIGSHILGHPFRFTISVAKIIAFIHVFVNYGYSVHAASGPSMLPTFEVLGESFWISKRHRYGRNLAVGDLVAYKIPIFPDADGIKRVLGMPGDYVLINSPESDSDTMIQVPEGHCWLVGDNLPGSRDSRMYGPVPLGLIKGKVVAKKYPWDRIRNPLEKPPETPK